MKSCKVLLGLLAGVAAGAILGILFAPDKGSKTRKQILDKGEDFAGSIKEKIENAVNSATKSYESSKEEVENLVSKGRNKYEEYKKDAKNTTI